MAVLLVNSESPASKGGLKIGDIILEINSEGINRIEDYYRVF